MPSPFPGMDPYVESHWHGCAVGMLTNIVAMLNAALPDRLVAAVCPVLMRLGPGLYITPDEGDGPAAARNVQIRVGVDGREPVTVIELLEGHDKPGGRFRREYLRRSAMYDAVGVNRVEIDLLRSRPNQTPPYAITTWRAGEPQPMRRGLSLREPLPTISIPLGRSDTGVELDLQAAFARAFEGGPYRSIQYALPPDPPLSPDDTAWADGLLAGRA